MLFSLTLKLITRLFTSLVGNAGWRHYAYKKMNWDVPNLFQIYKNCKKLMRFMRSFNKHNNCVSKCLYMWVVIWHFGVRMGVVFSIFQNAKELSLWSYTLSWYDVDKGCKMKNHDKIILSISVLLLSTETVSGTRDTDQLQCVLKELYWSSESNILWTVITYNKLMVKRKKKNIPCVKYRNPNSTHEVY